ncbi:MAG: hypothetical protein LAT61_00235 [Alcanivorax sp.]|nr:hypothetical protein [Alcanivorax sp.]
MIRSAFAAISLMLSAGNALPNDISIYDGQYRVIEMQKEILIDLQEEAIAEIDEVDQIIEHLEKIGISIVEIQNRENEGMLAERFRPNIKRMNRIYEKMTEENRITFLELARLYGMYHQISMLCELDSMLGDVDAFVETVELTQLASSEELYTEFRMGAKSMSGISPTRQICEEQVSLNADIKAGNLQFKESLD